MMDMLIGSFPSISLSKFRKNTNFEEYLCLLHNCSENDNEGRFRRKEIELRFRENILNGYKIPFEGAKDIDEGENSEMDYIIECINERNCLSLFELIIVSRSSSLFQYDQLALKFSPLSSNQLQNQYQLKISTKNKSPLKFSSKTNETVLHVKIEIEEKEKEIKFSLSIYEFIVLLNSSSSMIKIGRVYAIGGNSFERIYYQLVSSVHRNEIEINSLTGELFYKANSNLSRNESEMLFDVQASILKENSSKLFYRKCQVKLYLRQTDLLDRISFDFHISRSQQNQIFQVNHSRSCFVDENVLVNETFVQISIQSLFYPADQYILSLNNYLHFFSLLSSKKNDFLLQTKQKLHSTSIYLLNISVKHQLTQQFLPNLLLELIIINQWTTTTTRKTTTTIERMEFCQINQKYLLYSFSTNEIHRKKKKSRIGLLNVIHANSTMKNPKENFVGEINGNVIRINHCRMSFDQHKPELNQSLKHQLCLLFHSDICFNLSFQIQSTEKKEHISIDEIRFLTMKQIQWLMFIVSMMFIFITIILIFLICRLKDIRFWSTLVEKCFIHRKRFPRRNMQQDFTVSSCSSPCSSAKIEVRVFSSSKVEFIDDLIFRKELVIRASMENVDHFHFNLFDKVITPITC